MAGMKIKKDSTKPHPKTTFGNVGGGYMGKKDKYKSYLDKADPPLPKKKP